MCACVVFRKEERRRVREKERRDLYARMELEMVLRGINREEKQCYREVVGVRM